jgi:hypothetical protein
MLSPSCGESAPDASRDCSQQPCFLGRAERRRPSLPRWEFCYHRHERGIPMGKKAEKISIASSATIGEIRRLVQEGIDSGPGIDADQVFARLRAKYARRAEK